MQEITVSAVNAAATCYMILILLRAAFSWVPQLAVKLGEAARIITGLVDPFLSFISRILPVSAGRVDFAPVVAILLVEVARKGLIFLVVRFFGA